MNGDGRGGFEYWNPTSADVYVLGYRSGLCFGVRESVGGASMTSLSLFSSAHWRVVDYRGHRKLKGIMKRGDDFGGSTSSGDSLILPSAASLKR